MTTEHLGDDEIDAELELAIMGYDRRDKYPEWSNSAMREAYRAGFEDGGIEALSPLPDILAKHFGDYINFPPGPACNLLLLMLCEDTIAGIAHAIGYEYPEESDD